MSTSKSTYFDHDKDELLQTLARFDTDITVEDVTDGANVSIGANVIHDPKHYHTVFLQILIEAICCSFVENEQQREKVVTEICKRLSNIQVINPFLLLEKSNPLRMEIRQRFFDFIKQILKEVVPESDVDSSAVSFFESNLSADANLCYNKCFEQLEEIGKGGFGIVYKAKDKLTKHIYAVKKILFKYKNDSRFLKVIREAKNIAALDHPNVVCYENAWVEVIPTRSDALVNSTLDNGDRDRFEVEDIAYCTDAVSAIILTNNCSTESSESSRTIESCVAPNSNESTDSVIFSYRAENYSRNINWTVGSISENTNENVVDDSTSDDSDSSDKSTDKDDVSFRLNLNVVAVLYIQMEYCDCDLRFWLDERAEGNQLPFEMDVTEIFTNILSGVAHIHSKGIIHRDLKPQNIFYSKISNGLKIGDFGLATLSGCSSKYTEGHHLSDHHSDNIGTLPYAAPEQIASKSYDSKVDIYSLGIILIELMNTYSTNMEFSRGITEVKSGKITEEMKTLPKLVSIVQNLISKCPEDRMSAKEILTCLEEDTMVKFKEAEKVFKEELREMKAIIHQKDKEINRLKAEIIRLHKLITK